MPPTVFLERANLERLRVDQKQLQKLIKKYQDGTASAAEKFVVEYWYESLGKHTTEDSEIDFIPDRKNLRDRIILAAAEYTDKRSDSRRGWLYTAVASVILLIFSTVLYYQYYSGSQIDSLIEPIKMVYLDSGTISTGTAERTTVILNDGTKVILNANSSLTVGNYDRLRDVNLYGEAFFDVKKDPSRPFTVHGGGLHIKVLGTSFNVNAYPDIHNTAVSVRTGKVQVDNNEKNLRTLLPDENMVYDRKSSDFKLTNGTYPLESSWLSDHIKLDQASFEELSQTFKNFYGLTLYTDDEKILSDRYNISFRQSKTMATALEEIQLLTGKKISFKNKKEGKEIILY
ncbi:FecR family protein [Sphingobacterium sp. HMA12]|uniref:FecR family protein n=1 Tax=Sphingobacterium sp. HMA12 TaxID=2050894 RepID=UPI000CE9C0DB|nr:FecR family protein [Sphingobacterium sp. HMA12]